jgi:hypothetical protein
MQRMCFVLGGSGLDASSIVTAPCLQRLVLFGMGKFSLSGPLGPAEITCPSRRSRARMRRCGSSKYSSIRRRRALPATPGPRRYGQAISERALRRPVEIGVTISRRSSRCGRWPRRSAPQTNGSRLPVRANRAKASRGSRRKRSHEFRPGALVRGNVLGEARDPKRPLFAPHEEHQTFTEERVSTDA